MSVPRSSERNPATMSRSGPVDVLIVGAGPTGLTLAAQLRSFGISFRIIDRNLDRAHESRALAVQARSLELLQSLGLGETLVQRGNKSARLMIHFENAPPVQTNLGEFAATDTRFPFILFVSQAKTEAVLGDHLAAAGVAIERGVELIDFAEDREGMECVLRTAEGHEERVLARYIAGCDGAHSTVRKRAAISFQGDAYRHDFVLGDVEVDGPIPPDTLHSFAGRSGVAMFFPLRSPRTWRVIAMAGAGLHVEREHGAPEGSLSSALSLQELQATVDRATGGGLRLRDPAWLAHFRLHHRQAEHYRAGRVFLAGDAAHIHSPVGGQGMNTGIQDAWNLGWKLALVSQGRAKPHLLDSYEAERWPIGRFLLRYTDRVFGIFVRAMSDSALAAWVRRNVAARVLPRLLASSGVRASAFRFVSELGIHFRWSKLVAEGTPQLAAGPRAGERLPDARLVYNGTLAYLQAALSGPFLNLLLCGPPNRWDGSKVAALAARFTSLLKVHYVAKDESPGILVDTSGDALARLGLRSDAELAQYLVRPDGYIGFRCAGSDLAQLTAWLDDWFLAA
jgi:2-polyprenyl-6-methoxyphenol hydroxylase-like FAD-dependent oxidoreductase